MGRVIVQFKDGKGTQEFSNAMFSVAAPGVLVVQSGPSSDADLLGIFPLGAIDGAFYPDGHNRVEGVSLG